MDPILQVLLSWQFVMFGLAIAAVMYVLRIIVEYIFSMMKIDPKKPKWWNDLVLPILPVLLGPIASLHFQSFPYPDGLTTHGDRLIFGLVAGLLSTLMYRVVKALLTQKIDGTVLPSNNVPSVPVSPSVVVIPQTTTISVPDVPAVEDHNLPVRGKL